MTDLSNEMIEAAFKAAGAELALEYGDDENIVWTHQTFDDFMAARDSYAAAGRVERGDNWMRIEDAQISRGKPRCTIFVVDFGSKRASYIA